MRDSIINNNDDDDDKSAFAVLACLLYLCGMRASQDNKSVRVWD